MDIKKIVITGGPCAGKSTALTEIHDAFEKMGYTVLFIAETATELINGGVAPWTCSSVSEYEKLQMKLQLEREKIYELAASGMKAEKVLIVCDRGAMDNKAYMNDEEFAASMAYVGSNEVELRDGYDAVFHLVTAADGAENFYTTANNTARTESLEEARKIDRKILSAWTGHPHFRVIDNRTDFRGKMQRLIDEIAFFLGEPEPYEIERKYLIEYPDIDWLESIPNCRKVEIIQTYLKTPEEGNVRIRRRGIDGNYVYFKTIKRKITEVKRIEIESRLSEDEYTRLLENRGYDKQQLAKTRYCLTYDSQYFEIDVYPFWTDRAVMEIELKDENDEIRFPAELKIIREVTEEDEYKNSSLARVYNIL